MRMLALGIAVFAVALLMAAQLLLPGLAENRLRDELAAHGEVRSVEVAALPAVKLLFGRADRVEIEMGEVRAQQGQLADLLAGTAAAGELRARVETLRVGPFVAHDTRLDKRGERLTGRASVTEAELATALPVEVGLRPVESADGQLVLEATAGVLGQAIAVRARLGARDGALVIAPEGLLGGLATLTLFSDPRVRVRGVSAKSDNGGFTLSATATVSG